MAEYIDKVEAMNIIAGGKNDNAYFGTTSKDWEVIDFLKTVPTADVVERDEFESIVRSFKALVEMKNENLIDMRDKYYTLEKEYAELKVNVNKAIEEIEGRIKYSRLPTVDRYNRYSEGLKDCLEILKRNIGE